MLVTLQCVRNHLLNVYKCLIGDGGGGALILVSSAYPVTSSSLQSHWWWFAGEMWSVGLRSTNLFFSRSYLEFWCSDCCLYQDVKSEHICLWLNQRCASYRLDLFIFLLKWALQTAGLTDRAKLLSPGLMWHSRLHEAAPATAPRRRNFWRSCRRSSTRENGGWFIFLYVGLAARCRGENERLRSKNSSGV